ncbi:MAG: sigma-70 family RNA polymerase sigma factor, partial [Chitinophagales bacterium]|nr:sigma-70 family RNA polymerase sigma factor [Chitinophagales bacterium]
MENYQNILFPYAYNILGSVDEAQDAIQDVLLKYVQKEVQADNEKNYLIRSVINQSINRKRGKKRIKSESSFPKPIVTSYEDSSVETKDLLSYSLMILLEKLNAKERAVFILKEAFAYTHQEIAVVLSISVENSRKILSRATSKMRTSKPAIQRSSRSIAEKLEQFTSAIQSRDLDQLHHLLQEDIVFRADGGKEIKVVAK